MTLALSVASATAHAQQRAATAPECQPAGPVVKIPELPEASGLAISRRVPGRLWAHNDSAEPVLVALDTKGSVTGRLRLAGANVDDWEAIVVGPCPAGSCIYVADIGDNDADRQRITVYRVTEPAAASESATVSDVFHATYPDGRHDAESLLISQDGRLHIVTKGEGEPVAVYRFPNELRAGTSVQLERIGKPRESNTKDARITDATISPDGVWTVLRTNDALFFHRTAELMAGNWRESGRTDLRPLGEPQGEAVAVGTDGTIYLAGEGGGKSQPGTFARLICKLGP
jgi:hypothetical protein